MKIFSIKYLFLLALLSGSMLSVYCQEEDADVEVETEEDIIKTDGIINDATASEIVESEINTILHFVEPDLNVDAKEFPTNTLIRFLVGVQNAGKSPYVLDNVQASFRYPQDFSYHIQNFTALRYNRQLPASQESSLEYALQVHESFAGRPFGLVVLLNYHNLEGRFFTNTLYNETVMITEPEVGFDGETLFLYLLGLGLLALAMFFGYQYTVGKTKKRPAYKQEASYRPKLPGVETGTTKVNASQWVPEETMKYLQKSPKVSPKKSPRSKAK